MLELHLAVNGNDRGDGSALDPLATLNAARDRLRALRGHGPAGGATIWLRKGSYRLSEPFVLSAEDSGKPGEPVVYRAWPGEEVRLTGGVELTPDCFEPVSDAAVLKRLDPGIADRVVQIDLKRRGFDAGDGHGRGFAFAATPSDPDLYHGDEPLPVARWPRTGYARTGKVLDPGGQLGDPAVGNLAERELADARGAVFEGDRERIARWRDARNLQGFGFWQYEWAPATVPIAALDAEQGLITLGVPALFGRVASGKEYRILNVLEEIAEPGDWAVDRVRGILYLLPPERVERSPLCMSLLDGPLVAIRGGSHIVLRELVLECSRWHGVEIQGSDNLIAGCTLRNLGGRGVDVLGFRNGVQSCHVYHTGQGGIYLHGGDRRTLTAARNYADNNEIHDFNRVIATYNPAVYPMGCGQRVSHNRIYDGPHNAILVGGNDHVIEFNEIYDMCHENDDASAIYMAHNPSEQGNVIRHNFFHHIGSPTAWGTAAVYMDGGGACGYTIKGNVFYRCGHAGTATMGAIFNNGNKDHVIEDNVFVHCRLGIGMMLAEQKAWERSVLCKGEDAPRMLRMLQEEVDIHSELWLKRYPWLAELERNATRNTVRRNLAVHVGRLLAPEDRQIVEDNLMVNEDPGFADAERLDFELSPDAVARLAIPGFEPPPARKMGLYPDEYRHTLPDRKLVDSRLDLEKRPVVGRPGETIRFGMTARLANLSAQQVTDEWTIWSQPAGSVTSVPPGPIRTELGPKAVVSRTVQLEMTVWPDQPAAVGIRRRGELFSLPTAVQPIFRVVMPRTAADADLSEAKTLLKRATPLPFLLSKETRGELRASVIGNSLGMHVWVGDPALTQRDYPLADPGEGGRWGSPYFGLLAAPMEARDARAVRQVIFFPHGPGDRGSVWCFHGYEQSPPPEMRWATAPAERLGWEMWALTPLAELGLSAGARSFRMEAMINLTLEDGKMRLLTLFGSKTARLEIETMAEVEVT